MLRGRVTSELVVILIMFSIITAQVVISSGYTVGFWPFNITIGEPIHCEPACDSTEVTLNLFPGETQELERKIFNASEANLDVMFTVEVTPDDNIEVTIPDVFLVPGRGDTVQRIFISATKRAEPGEYRLVIGVDRGEY